MAAVMDKLRALRKLPARTLIAVFKGALAYIVLVILALSPRVRSGFSYPITLTSATVVVIAGFPGLLVPVLLSDAFGSRMYLHRS